MGTVKRSDVTYGQLSTALHNLGFSVSGNQTPLGFPYLRFKNSDGDTVIVVRGGAEDDFLNAADLLSAETTLEGRGVSDRETFYRLLREVAPTEAQVA